MYIPEPFRENDKDEIFHFLQANAFGQLISQIEGRLFCSHIPFLISEDRRYLLGHLAKANPQWRELEGQEVLVTFQGPHDYVSPSWYNSPGVPTWNYQAVHIYGECELIQQQASLRELVDSLSQIYESAFDNPWQPQYSENMLKAIVGFQLEIKDIQCKYKISQNRSIDDQKNVAEQFQQTDTKLSQAMQISIQKQTVANEDIK